MSVHHAHIGVGFELCVIDHILRSDTLEEHERSRCKLFYGENRVSKHKHEHEHKHDLSRLDDSELEQLGGIVAKLTGDQG
jgi:hypothetical protein